MRQRLPWLLALPVMAAGSLAAHSVTYLVTEARATESGAETSERTGSADANYLVLFLGIFLATALVAAAARLLLGRHCRRGGELSPWLFFVLPPLAFALQEASERLLRAEAFPFQAALEPRFVLGLLLQAPFGLLALLLARLVLRVAGRLMRSLEEPPKPRILAHLSWSPKRALDLPRIPAPALGYPERGPPPTA